MSDFQLQIEHHPETHLLQTLRLGPQRSVQVLRLFEKYYLLERNKGERRPPIQLEEAALISRLASEGRLTAAEIEPLLPPTRGFDIVLDDDTPETLTTPTAAPAMITPPAPSDPLESKLQNAMARFMEQNPETAAALKRHQPTAPSGTPAQQVPSVPPVSPTSAAESPFKSTYGAHPALGALGVLDTAQNLPSVQSLSAASVDASSGATREPALESLTQPMVQQALQQASDNQQKMLEQAALLKQDVDRRSERVQSALSRLNAFQERLDELNNRLEHWQSEMERHHFSRDSLLERTAEDLERLQRQLRQILSDGLALQKVLREHRFPDQDQMNDKLACFEDMLDHVVQQRHWVHYLQQQQAFAALERERVQVLVSRRTELKAQIAQLKDAIEQLEQINREILTRDPMAVPEPVPALALHELTRLDYELQILEADPGLQALEEKPER